MSWSMVQAAVRKVTVAVVGGLVTLVGVAMIVLPGPAIIVIPVGLSILGTEFHWARRLRDAFRRRFHRHILGKTSAHARKEDDPASPRQAPPRQQAVHPGR